MSTYAQILHDKQKVLRDGEAGYLRALEYVKSEQFTQDRLAALKKIESIMKTTYVEENEALFLMGRVAQVLEDAHEQENLVTAYQSVKKSVDELVAKSG